MKALFGLLIVTWSMAGFSQSTTNIVVTPQIPVECHLEDHRHVNWVYDIEKIEETNEEAVFQFKTRHGYCSGGTPVSYQLDSNWASVGMYSDGMLWPWQKELYEVSVFGSSPVEVIVVVTFDKTRLFKKRDQRHFDMGFYPFGYSGNFRYGWNVDVSLNSDMKMALKIR